MAGDQFPQTLETSSYKHQITALLAVLMAGDQFPQTPDHSTLSTFDGWRPVPTTGDLKVERIIRATHVSISQNNRILHLQEGNVLFNDTLNTFHLWLYGPLTREETCCRHMGYTSN